MRRIRGAELYSDALTLRKVFTYDPESGMLRRKKPRHLAGKEAGTLSTLGYRYVNALGKFHPVHRVIWCLMTGEWPATEVDHINGVRDDNRWGNLRGADRRQQCGNSKIPRNNTSGFKGVAWHGQQNKWRAYITLGGKQRHLGVFDDPQLAAATYNKAAREAYGDFARLNEGVA